MKAVRFSAFATAEEKNLDPVHPPTEMSDLTPYHKVSSRFPERRGKSTYMSASLGSEILKDRFVVSEFKLVDIRGGETRSRINTYII